MAGQLNEWTNLVRLTAILAQLWGGVTIGRGKFRACSVTVACDSGCSQSCEASTDEGGKRLRDHTIRSSYVPPFVCRSIEAAQASPVQCIWNCIRSSIYI